MLVLCRKAGQALHINDDIVIEVRRVVGDRVILAVHAPPDVVVQPRDELQTNTDRGWDVLEDGPPLGSDDWTA